MIIPIIKTENTVKEQWEKVCGEVIEVQFELNGGTKEKQLQECWDVAFANFKLMKKLGSEDDIIKAYKQVIQKLESRKRLGTIEIEEYLEL